MQTVIGRTATRDNPNKRTEMYANLKVSYHQRLGNERSGRILTCEAWSIDAVEDGVQLCIALDANDGTSSYCVEAGELTIAASDLVEVAANF